MTRKDDRAVVRPACTIARHSMTRVFVILGVVLWALPGSASAKPAQNFPYTSSGHLRDLGPLLDRPDIGGLQIVYSWKSLEPTKGRYDFSRIEGDLRYLDALHRKLFVQIQDRFFDPKARDIPAYLLNDPAYGGGLVSQSDNSEVHPGGSGWAAEQWNPAVRARFQALLSALARQFDGRVMGVNLPETAIDIDRKHDKTGFTCGRYFDATLQTMKFAKSVFHRSYVVQYVNFWPCEWNDDHHYMSRVFAFAERNAIGLGGPDIVPWKKGQMKNAYPFFHRYKGKLPLVAMAVQEPTLRYINPQTHKPFTHAEFIAFGKDYLGANIIFWATRSPWLKAPPSAYHAATSD